MLSSKLYMESTETWSGFSRLFLYSHTTSSINKNVRTEQRGTEIEHGLETVHPRSGFSRLFRLDWAAVPFSFRPKFPAILAQWIAPWKKTTVDNNDLNTVMVRTVERNQEIAIRVVSQLRMLLEIVTLPNVFLFARSRSRPRILPQRSAGYHVKIECD